MRPEYDAGVEVALLTTLIVLLAGSFWQQFQNYVKLRDRLDRSNKETRDLIQAGLTEHGAQLRTVGESLANLRERTARIEGILSERERRDDEPEGDGGDAA